MTYLLIYLLLGLILTILWYIFGHIGFDNGLHRTSVYHYRNSKHPILGILVDEIAIFVIIYVLWPALLVAWLLYRKDRIFRKRR